MTHPAARLQKLPPYPFALINQRIRALKAQGIDIINLDVGSPDLPPAPFVVEALSRSAEKAGHHGYAGYKGTPEFRRAVAGYYQTRFGIEVDPETQVLPLMGSKEGIVNLALAYVDKGDVALVPEIGYPSYAMGTLIAGGEVAWIPVPAENGFLPALDEIPADTLKKAKLLWVNYPSNPTGVTVDQSFYERVVNFCAEHDILLASDNPYVDVTYDGYVAGSALGVPNALNHAVEFISFSKTYNMAGWRLGAAVGHAEAIQHLLTVKSNIDSGHFQAVYDAGIAALEQTTQAWIDERNQVYQDRRDLILEALPHIGLTAEKPKGSLYVWAKVDSGNGADYVENMLVNAHVSMAPGSMYGPGGEHYVRMSLSVSNDRLAVALERMKAAYARK